MVWCNWYGTQQHISIGVFGIMLRHSMLKA